MRVKTAVGMRIEMGIGIETEAEAETETEIETRLTSSNRETDVCLLVVTGLVY